jgi:hypothetical protein
MENKTVETAKKKSIAEALIGQIKEKDEKSRIKTNIIEGFQQPEKITVESDGKTDYVPDVVSETGDQLDLYEIEIYEQNYVIEKWRKFSDYSYDTNGSFHIVVPKSHLDTLKDILDLNKIHANIIYFYS